MASVVDAVEWLALVGLLLISGSGIAKTVRDWVRERNAHWRRKIEDEVTTLHDCCDCMKCQRRRLETFAATESGGDFFINRVRMAICHNCGSKRCATAEDHAQPCVNGEHK